MPAPVSRPIESRAVGAFLTAAGSEPSGLVMEGEAGIGKTTLWLSALQEARERGFRVLSARPAATESVLAYSSAADLLTDVDQAVWADLPPPQRRALDQVLLQADGQATDHRTVAAGFLSAMNALANESPLLLAVDDLQWLDVSSKNVIAYVARRLVGRVGVLGCVRIKQDNGEVASWLHMPRPDAMSRITVSPLRLGGLHRVVSVRLGRSLPRSTMVRIWEISGGNPFYALELARATVDSTTVAESPLPRTLAELVLARIGDLSVSVQDVLLAAACVTAPTVELVGRATDTDEERVVELLAEAESKGIVTIEAHLIRFAHPLLAHGVYNNAPPARRRVMHRRLAEIVDEPELQARHLALAAIKADPQTLESLDAAAEMARNRGAPAAAAELLDLALGLGGDTPERRIRLARHRFTAGDTGRARDLLEETIDQLEPGPLRAEALILLATAHLSDDSFLEAADLLERALGEAGDNQALRVQSMLSLSYARMNVLQLDGAVLAVEDAVTDAERLGQPHLLSQALGMRVTLRFMRGEGLDEHNLRRALESQVDQAGIPMACRPPVHKALLLAWTGQLGQAHEEMLSIRRRCIEHGEENELMFVAFHSALIAIWRADLSEAAVIGEDTMERSLQLGGDLPLFTALAIRGALAAYAGQLEDARRDAREALEASQRCGSYTLAGWPITTLGFVEVSQGNYQAALATLEPLLGMVAAAPNATEIFATSFVPDAAEAMIQLGRLTDAEWLANVMERNGARLDRPWMLAIGARARSMLLAARGDVEAAIVAAQAAMVEHGRLPMPFQRARTQLLLGQLQRRQRLKAAASATLRDAVQAFDRIGAPLWAERARAELARADVAHSGTAALTPSEQRVAELAADGMSNRDIASALFISPKTVEANLARVYRKLGIRTRAQLGRHIRPRDQ